MFRDFFLLAARSIAHRKVRSWLTIIGVFIGITAVVALISIGLGLEKTINDQVSDVFGVDTFIISPEGTFGPGGAHADATFAIDLDHLRSIDGIQEAAAIRDETGFVQGSPDEAGDSIKGLLSVVGLSPELLTDFSSFIGDIELEPGGRNFTATDRNVAILGNAVATRLNATVGSTIEIEGQPFEIVGVVVPGEDDAAGRQSGGMMSYGRTTEDTIYVPYDVLLDLYGPADSVLVTLVRVAEGTDVDEAADRVETDLNERGADIMTITYTDISDMVGTMMSTISAFLAGIAGISLLVGAVGVMNTMFTSVLERTKEIGVMKAVGAKNSHVWLIFLIESGMMGLVGGAVGTILGLALSWGASALLSRVFGIDIAVVASAALIAITLAGSFALGAIAGLWPARRASKLLVVDALRYE
ncbi:ABC transporter permease [Candidatus Bipolaricaulota bacterium]|nr:ABC transporter permease [Candidatus Bipolaricaulota bacterium]